MRGSRLLAWLGIGLLVGLLLAPTTALAGRGHGGRGGGGRGHGGHHHGGRHNGVSHHKGHHHNGLVNTTDGFRNTTNGFHNGFHHKGHRFGHGFVSSCCAGVVYAPPAYYYPPAVEYAPPPVYPVSYEAPPVYTAAPMVGTRSVTLTPALPSVVEYPPHGRYELRGDGVTTAYTWVWIPNPPPAPPPAAPAPPAAPPAVAPPTDPPPASDAPRPRLYRWTDDLGVTHLTNRADAVPPEYRKPTAPAAP